MNNDVIEKTTKYAEKQIPDSVLNAAKQFGTKAATLTSDYAGKAADYTEKSVKKYPLAAIGIALGGGVLLGTLGTILFMPKERTVVDRFSGRINDLKLGRTFRKLMSQYF